MIVFHAAIFAWFMCSFGLPYCAPVAYHLERSAMPLHDAVEGNCEQGQLNIEALVPCIWAMGRMFLLLCVRYPT